jgi:formate-dependent nitrite reductase membrane component NrfD/ferredoxin
MYQRADGIVEFDSNICIGCKACLQACPYDAIYIDPNSGTAAKCHYCAHRTEIGLEPACVVVCPEHAIISGDMNDPTTEISQLLARQDVTVRKPEQGTSPKLFYINGNDVVMHPTATSRTPQTFMWADVIPLHGEGNGHHDSHAHGSPIRTAPRTGLMASSGSAETKIRLPQSQGTPSDGPIQLGMGRMSEHMVQVGYNAQHKVPWHWPVPAYLVTKGIGAGIFMMLSLGWGLDLFPFDALTAVVGGLLSLLFIAITTGLLVIDLEKPERFLYILMRPQWKSWLTRGAVLLIGFSTLVGVWWAVETGSYLGLLSPELATSARPFFLWLGLPFAIGSAVYTAFLFAQAEGRDLWQSPLLPIHLVIQAFMMGSASLLVVGAFVNVPFELVTLSVNVFFASLIVDLFVTLVGEFSIPHASEVAAQAAHDITHGRYKNHFWLGSIVLGHVVPLVLLLATFFGMAEAVTLGTIAALCAMIGLYLFEYAFVMAPQDIPNS